MNNNPLTKYLLLGTIHKRRLPKGGGRGDPKKAMGGDGGRDPIFVVGDVGFLALKTKNFDILH